MGRLGDMANVYQQDGWADVEFLDAFDGDVLAGVDLRVAGDSDNALTATYSLNADTGTHTLAVNQNGYEYELSAETYLDHEASALQENALYQQYKEVLVDTTRSYKAGEFSGGVTNLEAVEFFLDGLEAILSPLNIDRDVTAKSEIADDNVRADTGVAAGSKMTSNVGEQTSHSVSDYLQEQRVDKPVEEAFLSGLPDFSASFNTPRFLPNESDPGEVSQMTLNLEQVTEVSTNLSNGVKTIDQRYSFESHVSQHFGIGGDSMEHANLGDVTQPGGQTYLYEVVDQSTTLTRSLDIDSDGAVVGYREAKESEHTKTTKEVVEGNVVGIHKEDLSDPQDNYAFSLQVPDSPAEQQVKALQIEGYRDIQMLQEAIKSQRIDLYS